LNSTAISSIVTRLQSRVRCSICCFTVSIGTLTGLHHWCFVFRFEIFPPIHTLSPDSNNCLYTESSLLYRFQKVLHLLTTKKRITLCCSSMVQVNSGAAMLYELLRRLILLDPHDRYTAYC
jgi:hypothetical protein